MAKVSSIPSTDSVRCVRHHTCVVDEHIEPAHLGAEALGELPHGLKVAEITELDLHIAVARSLHHGLACALAALLAAGEQPYGGAKAREALGSGQPESRGCAGHQDDLAIHWLQVRRIPRAPADAITHARVAADHGAIENGVQQRADHGARLGTLGGNTLTDPA